MATKSRPARPMKTDSSSHSLGVSDTSLKRSAKSKSSSLDDDKDSLAFKVLSVEDTKSLCALDDIDEVQEKMADVMKLSEYLVDLKEAITLDYLVAGFWWGAKEQNFSQEQISAFITVLHTLLENIKERHVEVTENLKEFKKMLAGVGTTDCLPELSGGLECFSTSQVCSMVDYLQSSLFQHHNLYNIIFSRTQAEEVIGTDLEVEIPLLAETPWPPPLIEGVPESLFTEFIATPPPTPPPAEEESADATGGAQTEQEEREAGLLAQLSPDEVRSIMDSVFEEMLTDIKTDVAAKLRDKENAYITRIRKLQK